MQTINHRNHGHETRNCLPAPRTGSPKRVVSIHMIGRPTEYRATTSHDAFLVRTYMSTPPTSKQTAKAMTRGQPSIQAMSSGKKIQGVIRNSAQYEKLDTLLLHINLIRVRQALTSSSIIQSHLCLNRVDCEVS